MMTKGNRNLLAKGLLFWFNGYSFLFAVAFIDAMDMSIESILLAIAIGIGFIACWLMVGKVTYDDLAAVSGAKWVSRFLGKNTQCNDDDE